MNSLLSVRDLTVEISAGGAWFPAVDRVGFDVHEGESVALVGETGCGKTLLARALIGLLPEAARVSGSVLYRGVDLLLLSEPKWNAIRGREIAMIFQEPAAALDPVQTIGAQIVEALSRRRSLPRALALAKARELLAEARFHDPGRGIEEYPHRLSGGERQRAAIAISLAGDPAILLADEPTSALDATVAAEILELLDRLRRERNLSVLLITHDLAAVARHSDRCLVLYAGRVAEEAATARLFRSPKHPYTAGLLACIPRLASAPAERPRRVPAIAGAVPELSFRPKGRCPFSPRCPERFEACDASEPPSYPVEDTRVRCFLYSAGDTGGRVVSAG